MSEHSDRPAPMTPADCDLRDFPRMMVDIPRLFASEFDAVANDTEWRCGFTLWLKSFHQVPAASLPDDDVQLAKLPPEVPPGSRTDVPLGSQEKGREENTRDSATVTDLSKASQEGCSDSQDGAGTAPVISLAGRGGR